MEGLIKITWPQLYLAIYYGHNQIYYSGNTPYVNIKIGSTTGSISGRTRSESGQLSNVKLLELVGLCVYNESIENNLLRTIEDNVRYLVKEVYESRHNFCGWLSQENFLIPLSDLEEFIKDFKTSTNEVLKSYELFKEAQEIISYGRV